jgi:gliding motility-associated-like protein
MISIIVYHFSFKTIQNINRIMKHCNYAIIGFIACLLFSTNLQSQVLLPKNGEKQVLTNLFGSNYKLKACERFYLQFVQICEGQRFRVVDSFYTRAGTYTNTTRTAEGCDSIITTILNLIPSQRTDTAAFVCFGKCFKVGTKCYTQSGNYADTLKTRFGCDSIIRLNLTVLKPDSVQQNAIICDGQSFRVGNRIYFASGNYRDTIPNADGCFRIIKTSLTIRNKASIIQNPTLCEGGRITVGTNTYDRTGVYRDTLRTIAGCDSFITTNLTVLPSIKKTLDSMVCSGKSVLFGDTLRTSSGMYRRVLRSFNGCDSTITLNLTVTPPLTSTINMTQCSGKSVTIGGNMYNRTGTYTIPFKTAGGCDSLVILNLIVPRPPNALRTITLCGGKDTLIDGKRYNQTGIFRDTLKAVSGCDSLVKVLSINILPPNETYIGISFCRNATNMTSGTYRNVFTSSTGCDSVVVLTVKVNDTFNIRQTKELCVGDSLRVGNKIYKTSGNYTDFLKTVDGCDSTIFTNLKILDPLSITQSKSLCKGESLKVGNKTYSTAGTYVDKLTSVKGCDSTVTSIIKVNDLPVLTLPQGLKPKFCSDSLELNPKGDTASKYTWQWKTVSCASCRNPKIKPISTATYYVTVTDKTTTCTTSDSVKITLDGTYAEKIPNAFTPNGDNLNEIFNIAPDDCIKSVKRLQVFSRIGDLVFDKSNLSPRNNEGWNGLSKDSPLGADVYVYVMEILFTDGTTKKVSGEVNLIH